MTTKQNSYLIEGEWRGHGAVYEDELLKEWMDFYKMLQGIQRQDRFEFIVFSTSTCINTTFAMALWAEVQRLDSAETCSVLRPWLDKKYFCSVVPQTMWSWCWSHQQSQSQALPVFGPDPPSSITPWVSLEWWIRSDSHIPHLFWMLQSVTWGSVGISPFYNLLHTCKRYAEMYRLKFADKELFSAWSV